MLVDNKSLHRQPIQHPSVLAARVVFLTHYIPLYQVRVLQSIASMVRDFHVLLSTPIEPNRDFAPDWSGLDVTVQDTWTLRRRWRHQSVGTGFEDQLYVHIPYDTSRQLKALNPDVVMSLELGARSLGATRYCRRHPKTKSVLCTYMSEHTESSRGWLRKQLRQRLVHRCDALTYNGPSCKNYLLSLGAREDRLHHFPYAADDRSVYAGPVERDDQQTRQRLLCVGQLSQRKGIMPMLSQLSEYCEKHPDREIELAIAGSGPLQNDVRAFITPANLSVELLGNLSPDELAMRMLDSGALIAPTLADEWMLVVNEALHAGAPVIGSIYAQAVTTLIRDGINGWQYDPAAPTALHTALDAYLNASSESIAQMRVDARQSVAERTPQWAAAGAMGALRSVLGQPPVTETARHEVAS